MTSEETLRAAYQRAVEARRGATREGCVGADELLDLVRRDGPEARRLATLDHAMACRDCREEFELLRAIEQAGGEDVRQTLKQLRWRRYASVAIAASVLALAIGPGRRFVVGDEQVMRGADDSLETVAPAVDATIGDGPTTFAWRAVPDARSYVLELLDPAGNVTIARQTTDTSAIIAIDPAVGAGTYTWWVRATRADGTVRRSGVRKVRVVR